MTIIMSIENSNIYQQISYSFGYFAINRYRLEAPMQFPEKAFYDRLLDQGKNLFLTQGQ